MLGIKNKKTIDIKDALDLENYERITTRNRFIRRAINDTYGPKSPTKKRHKLSGKRKWKNKELQYKKLNQRMTNEEKAAKKKANAAIERIYRQRQKQEKKHLLYGDE